MFIASVVAEAERHSAVSAVVSAPTVHVYVASTNMNVATRVASGRSPTIGYISPQNSSAGAVRSRRPSSTSDASRYVLPR